MLNRLPYFALNSEVRSFSYSSFLLTAEWLITDYWSFDFISMGTETSKIDFLILLIAPPAQLAEVSELFLLFLLGLARWLFVNSTNSRSSLLLPLVLLEGVPAILYTPDYAVISIYSTNCISRPSLTVKWPNYRFSLTDSPRFDNLTIESIAAWNIVLT